MGKAKKESVSMNARLDKAVVEIAVTEYLEK